MTSRRASQGELARRETMGEESTWIRDLPRSWGKFQFFKTFMVVLLISFCFRLSMHISVREYYVIKSLRCLELLFCKGFSVALLSVEKMLVHSWQA
jgi:hypothetical protein